MQKRLNTLIKICIGMVGMLILVLTLCPCAISADEKTYNVVGKSFEIDDNSGFNLRGHLLKKFCASEKHR